MVIQSDVSRRLERPDLRYLHPVFLQGKPLDDAVLTELGFSLALLVRNVADVLGEGTTPGAADWTVKESSRFTTNNFQLEGGSGSFETQSVIFASGLPAIILGDKDYNFPDSQAIHAASDSVEATKLFDAGLNLEPGELVGRNLVPNVADGTAFPITANSKNVIEVQAGDDMTVVATSGDRYRVNLSTPSGTDRTDVVYLDIYVSEVDSRDDPALRSNISGVLVETAHRRQIQQVVRVRENVGSAAGQFADPVDPGGTGREVRVYTDERGQRHGVIKLASMLRPDGVADILPSDVANGTVITDARPQGFARTALAELRDFTSTPGQGLNFKGATLSPDSGIRVDEFSAGNPFATVRGDLSKLIDQSRDVTSPAVQTIGLEVRTLGDPDASLPATAVPGVRIDNKRRGAGLEIVNDGLGEEGLIVQQVRAFPGILLSQAADSPGLQVDQSGEAPGILITGTGTTTAAVGAHLVQGTPGIGLDVDVADGDGIDVALAVAGDTGIRVSSVSAVEGEACLDFVDNSVVTTGSGSATVRAVRTGSGGTSRGNVFDLTYAGTPDLAQDPICLNIVQGPARGIRISALDAASTFPMLEFDQDGLGTVVEINKASGTTGDVINIVDSANGLADAEATLDILMNGGIAGGIRTGIRVIRSDGDGPNMSLTKSGTAPIGGDLDNSPLLLLDPTSWIGVPHMVMEPLAAAPSFSARAGALVTALDAGDIKLYINEGAGNNWNVVGAQVV